jgi:hypothetical protein
MKSLTLQRLEDEYKTTPNELIDDVENCACSLSDCYHFGMDITETRQLLQNAKQNLSKYIEDLEKELAYKYEFSLEKYRKGFINGDFNEIPKVVK